MDSPTPALALGAVCLPATFAMIARDQCAPGARRSSTGAESALPLTKRDGSFMSVGSEFMPSSSRAVVLPAGDTAGTTGEGGSTEGGIPGAAHEAVARPPGRQAVRAPLATLEERGEEPLALVVHDLRLKSRPVRHDLVRATTMGRPVLLYVSLGPVALPDGAVVRLVDLGRAGGPTKRRLLTKGVGGGVCGARGSALRVHEHHPEAKRAIAF
jgi:hypothetical protein